jgi:sulfate adenylyltransferase
VLGLDAQRCALLQALVSRNYGATSFVLNSQVPAEAQRWLLQHRDEIGLEVIPSKRKQSTNKTALNLAA